MQKCISRESNASRRSSTFVRNMFLEPLLGEPEIKSATEQLQLHSKALCGSAVRAATLRPSVAAYPSRHSLVISSVPRAVGVRCRYRNGVAFVGRPIVVVGESCEDYAVSCPDDCDHLCPLCAVFSAQDLLPGFFQALEPGMRCSQSVACRE